MDAEQRLIQAGRTSAGAGPALEAVRRKLDRAIRAARRDGMSVRRISELTGLSYRRVLQVVHKQ